MAHWMASHTFFMSSRAGTPSGMDILLILLGALLAALFVHAGWE